MTGIVTDDGDPIVELVVAGRTREAVVDTGFNGDLELPEELQEELEGFSCGWVHSHLAAGQSVLEEEFKVFFPFDGELREASATFVRGRQILIGTSMLRRHYLGIDFVAQTVLLERVA